MAGGSFAAAWQAYIGAIQSGSLFATLQSIAMGGIGGGTIALGGMTGGVAAAAAISTVCAAVDKAAEQPGAVQDLLSAVAAIRARLSRNARRFRARL